MIDQALCAGSKVAFERLEDGGVLIGTMRAEHGTPVVHTESLSAAEWCEAIAGVTPLGLTGASIIAARVFHGFRIV